jgi:hypothetical protein
VSREHRRPLIAFVVVALLCALVVGNSITLASGSSRNLEAEVRAAVVGESPANSPTDGSTAALIDDAVSRSPDRSAVTPSNLTSTSPSTPGTGNTSPRAPSGEDEVEQPPTAETEKGGNGNKGTVESPSGGTGSDSPVDPGPSSTPSTPNPEPTPSPTPSTEPSPTEPPSEEAPESEPVLTFDDITNPPPPVEPDPGPTGEPETGDESGGSLESTDTQGDAPVGRVSEGSTDSPQEEAPTE